MKRRLFIAVAFPDRLIREIEQDVEALRSRALDHLVRFVPQENWHATVLFLGEIEEEKIAAVREAMDEALERVPHERITFDAVTYGPPQHTPRMIWLTADAHTSQYLGSLKQELAHALHAHGVQWAEDPHTNFHGHVTLAHFHTPTDAPPLLQHTACTSGTYSIDLFESVQLTGGMHYASRYSIARG